MSSFTVTTRSLGEAITLHHVSTERFKTARLTFLTVRPADEIETPLSTLHYGIMRRGSEKYARLSLLNHRLDELYGSMLTIRNSLYGDQHVMSFVLEIMEDDYRLPHDTETDILDGSLELLADMFLHTLTDSDGLLRAETVKAEKQYLIDCLRATVNDSRSYASERFRYVMCPGEPYGISIGGTPESVAAITPSDVTDHRKRALASTRCEVFYVGKSPVERVSALLEKHFGTWKPTLLSDTKTLPHPVPAEPRYAEESRPISQGKLCVGWSCGENVATADLATRSAMQVCNMLFGAMPTSLLFRHVREELGLCYYCESSLNLHKGILWVASGIRSDRREEAEAAIRACLARMQAGEMDPADVETAKTAIIENYRQLEDSQSAISAFLINRVMDSIGEPCAIARSPEEKIEAIAAVTPMDVAAAARRFSLDTVYFLRGTVASEEDEDGNE